MNRDFLITLLQNVKNAKRAYRNEAALIIIKNPSLFPYLVNETFNVNDILSIRAAWILEWICTHEGLELLLPYLDTFTKNLHKIHFPGTLRTCAKICEHISIAFNASKPHDIKSIITKKQIDRIIEVGFDWLITSQKIAVKAYTMNTLYQFGLQVEWIHPDLEIIIKKDIIHQSTGCENRGKKILRLIEKKSNIS